MLAVDTNLLVYAHRREVAEHSKAMEQIVKLAESQTPRAIPWPCVYEFFSVVTNTRIWKDRSSAPAQAWGQVSAWANSPSLRFLAETDRFIEILADLVNRPRVRGPIVHDARIAALCIAHGVEGLISRDRDFSLFPEVRVINPFA